MSRAQSADASAIGYNLLCKKPFRKGALSYGCGQCLPCRINLRRSWSLKIVLETNAHKNNSFVTLTYADKHLPKGGVLVKRDYVTFLKKLRRKLGFPIRFKVVGEYGDLNGRPHYHFALFGYPHCPYYNFGDQNNTEHSCPCPTCQLIHLAWGKGKVDVAQLSPESAAYIAGYVTKKMTRDTSEVQKTYLAGRPPEFSQQSNGGRTKQGGIGANIVDSYLAQCGGLLDENDDLISSIKVGPRLTYLPRSLKNRLRNKAGLSEKYRKEINEKLSAKAVQELYTDSQGNKVIDYETETDTLKIIRASKACEKANMDRFHEAQQRILNLEKREQIKRSKGKKL